MQISLLGVRLADRMDCMKRRWPRWALQRTNSCRSFALSWASGPQDFVRSEDGTIITPLLLAFLNTYSCYQSDNSYSTLSFEKLILNENSSKFEHLNQHKWSEPNTHMIWWRKEEERREKYLGLEWRSKWSPMSTATISSCETKSSNGEKVG